jgi:hypothetical protein
MQYSFVPLEPFLRLSNSLIWKSKLSQNPKKKNGLSPCTSLPTPMVSDNIPRQVVAVSKFSTFPFANDVNDPTFIFSVPKSRKQHSCKAVF